MAAVYSAAPLPLASIGQQPGGQAKCARNCFACSRAAASHGCMPPQQRLEHLLSVLGSSAAAGESGRPGAALSRCCQATRVAAGNAVLWPACEAAQAHQPCSHPPTTNAAPERTWQPARSNREQRERQPHRRRSRRVHRHAGWQLVRSAACACWPCLELATQGAQP